MLRCKKGKKEKYMMTILLNCAQFRLYVKFCLFACLRDYTK